MSRELIRAVFKGDIGKFDSLFERADIHTVTEKEKWNVLHRALVSVTLKPVPKMIKHLIDIGIDVNAEDCYGNTPLHYASRSKHYDVIQILLDAGAKIDHVNFDGITPLRHMLLSKPTNIDAVELLLSYGADLEHRTESGATIRKYVESIAHGDDAPLLDLIKKYSKN